MDAASLQADELGLEEYLGAAEALVADGDDVVVGELVAPLEEEFSEAVFISRSKSRAT